MEFADLIHPTTPAAFFDEYWERKPLVVARSDPEYFRDVFSTVALEEVIYHSRLHPPDIRVVREQQDLLPDRYIAADGGIHLNQLYKAYDEGYSIVVNGLQRFWGPVASLVRAVRSTLTHHVVANAYLTPAGATALAPHYDTHDVFVLQIEGEKRWWIHAAPQETPLLGSFQPVIPVDQCGPLLFEVVVKAGDLMYVPRGFVHRAETTGRHSLHMTLGVYPAQRLDLVTSAITALAMRDVRFRKALAPGYLRDPDAPSTLQGTLVELLQAALENARAADALSILRDRMIRDTPDRPDGQLSQLNRLAEITLDTYVERREGMECRVLEDLFSVRIQFPGNTVKGTPPYADGMRFIADAAGPFTPRDLPGALTDDRKLGLVRRLVRGGLLRISERVGAPAGG